MTENEFRDAIAFGREQRHVEFKAPGPRTDKQLLARVIRAMLGMANKANGGYVIVGVRDDGTSLYPEGVCPSDAATWKYDDLASSVAEYADPFISFTVGPLSVDGVTYVVIEVQEFESVPVVCRRAFGDVLKDGACYVRGRVKIETVEVNSHVLVRELIDRATDIHLRKELDRLQKLGLLRFTVEAKPRPTDDELFEAQIGDLS